jgi:hypothetical protein
MTVSVHKLRSVIISVLLVLLGGVIGYRLGSGAKVPLFSSLTQVLPSTRLVNTKAPDKYHNVDFSQFWAVWGRLEDQYFDPSKLDAQKMVSVQEMPGDDA